MGYRLQEQPAITTKLVRLFDDTASPVIISVDNGTVSRISIPCEYGWLAGNPPIVRMMIDHAGWPSPGHPDRSCQDMSDVTYQSRPIDLEAEGYESVEVSLNDPPYGLSVEGNLTGSLVSVTITSMCPDAINHDVYVEFSAYLVGATEGFDHEVAQLRDIGAKGVIHIVAGPVDVIPDVTPPEPQPGPEPTPDIGE